MLGTTAIVLVVLVVGFALSVVGAKSLTSSAGGGGASTPMTPLQARIVSIAQGQVGYATDPPDTYCNKYSAYWSSGSADCSNGNMDEQWCADFAAWVWKKAGATVDYQYVNGDINASAASFYEWGMDHGTWHPVGAKYVPQPGDVAVYGLDAATLVAAHVAVVISYTAGDRGPNVVNGDGDQRGFSVVETGVDEIVADVPNSSAARLAGYVSPLPSSSS
ncbi:MAG TPA: CHAP domain-containing protein [Acidimicrobiales bacterium]